jgi:hypothetical protein
MVEPSIAYHVVGLQQDAWFDDAAAADASAARQLGIDPSMLEPLRRRISVDPVVVRRDGSRWRSRRMWNVRSGERTVRIDEMVKVDEAAYDH